MVGDLEMFLLGLQLGHLTPLFLQHKVDFAQLLSMTDSDLRLMGVAQVGARKKILNGVLEVHKREWLMPDCQLPYGRPIRSGGQRNRDLWVLTFDLTSVTVLQN